MVSADQNRPLRVDTHVHMHACFEQDRFLDAAADNLQVGTVRNGRVDGMLCLTETAEADWFDRVVASFQTSGNGSGHWCFEPTEESNSCLAVNPENHRIAIIAGRQIVTGEGLEVLALGLKGRFEDGRPLTEVLEAVARAGAVPVVPWGFGKWTGRRGKLVRQLIADPPCNYYLGDNGGRLAMMDEPPEFEEARARGIRILPGTDPFPFSWDVDRVGSFGLEWEGVVAVTHPFRSLQSLLADTTNTLQPYGRLEGLPGFVRNQFAIQVRKWSRKLRW